jgi:hypothetical protein
MMVIGDSSSSCLMLSLAFKTGFGICLVRVVKLKADKLRISIIKNSRKTILIHTVRISPVFTYIISLLPALFGYT